MVVTAAARAAAKKKILKYRLSPQKRILKIQAFLDKKEKRPLNPGQLTLHTP